jgi:uncharacterized protein YbjT (DUF2867 family)
MKVCIAGASGLIGSHLVQQLTEVAAVTEIITLTRSPLPATHPKIKNQAVDFNALPAISAEIYVSCLGTTIKVAGSQAAFKKVDHDYVLNFGKMAEKSGATKFMVVSATGANAKSTIFYNRTKGEMERDIAQLNIPEIATFRPSLLLGDRKESRPLEVIAQKAAPFFNALLQGPLKKLRAVHAADVARAMISVIFSSKSGFRVCENDEIQKLAQNNALHH